MSQHIINNFSFKFRLESLAVIFFVICSFLFSKDQGAYVQNLTSFYNSSLIKPNTPSLIKEQKLLSLYTSDSLFNSTFFNLTRKIREIKKGHEAGYNGESIIFFNRYEKVSSYINADIDLCYKCTDLQTPLVVPIDLYVEIAKKEKYYSEFKKKIINSLTRSNINRSGSGKSVSLINTQVADTEVELNINGNIKIDGSLQFEDKELIAVNSQENKNWDIDIEQKQNFNIDGVIGEKLYVKITQKQVLSGKMI